MISKLWLFGKERQVIYEGGVLFVKEKKVTALFHAESGEVNMAPHVMGDGF